MKNIDSILGTIYRFLLSNFGFWLLPIGNIIKKFFNYNPQKNALEYAFKFIAKQKVIGDYLEFGVFEGKSFINAYQAALKNSLFYINFYAFDSFQGLPLVAEIDQEGLCRFERGMFACSLDQFKKNIQKKGGVKKSDLFKIKIIDGWYKDTLNNDLKKNLPLKKAAVVLIDCDLYESTVTVLEFITDYIQKGTIILFDDWFIFPNGGEKRALGEWLKNHSNIRVKEFYKFGYAGNSFLVI